jgi:hypothetical protein
VALINAPFRLSLINGALINGSHCMGAGLALLINGALINAPLINVPFAFDILYRGECASGLNGGGFRTMGNW